MNIDIVGFIGVIGSGKSYETNKLKNQGYKHLSFAECSKDLLWEVIQWKPMSEKEESDFKDSYKLYIDNNKNDYHYISGRNLIINFSQKLKENFGKNVWVDHLLMKIKKGIINDYNKFVISDVRFYNEIYAIQDYCNYRRKEFNDKVNLKFIFCNYKSDRYCVLDTESEKLAQDLLKKGYDHLQIISF
jgi:uncharacterized protein YcgL (UPF0745 family)